MQKGGKDPIVEELKKIKNLLMLDLYSRKIPSGEINKAVGIGAARIRSMFSKKNLKKMEKGE
jgi:hypothetical protein